MYALIRPLLFSLAPERAHRVTLVALDIATAVTTKAGIAKFINNTASCPQHVMGLAFPNPVGLAAGLDKNGDHILSLAALATFGLGFIEIGTVTPRPQPGNPQPRLFRLPQAQAIINRMGFNNLGVEHLVAQVERARNAGFAGILGINIGKNFDTPIAQAADDYLMGLRKVYAHASYVTINISSPNTANLRTLQQGDELDALLGTLKREQQTLADHHKKYVPLAVKIAPDLDDAQIEHIAGALERHKIDAVIATNTTLSRDAVAGLPHANEAGGLSGAPLKSASLRVVRALRARMPALPIIGVGGIMNGDDARAFKDAGANLVQIYTGLIYRGTSLIKESVNAYCK